MSEYQCYELAALDRPLTAKQMDELRRISTRAEISPARFWNEYQWGDLKAGPAKLVERYFARSISRGCSPYARTTSTTRRRSRLSPPASPS